MTVRTNMTLDRTARRILDTVGNRSAYVSLLVVEAGIEASALVSP